MCSHALDRQTNLTNMVPRHVDPHGRTAAGKGRCSEVITLTAFSAVPLGSLSPPSSSGLVGLRVRGSGLGDGVTGDGTRTRHKAYWLSAHELPSACLSSCFIKSSFIPLNHLPNFIHHHTLITSHCISCRLFRPSYLSKHIIAIFTTTSHLTTKQKPPSKPHNCIICLSSECHLTKTLTPSTCQTLHPHQPTFALTPGPCTSTPRGRWRLSLLVHRIVGPATAATAVPLLCPTAWHRQVLAPTSTTTHERATAWKHVMI